jgi:hypothetical protein
LTVFVLVHPVSDIEVIECRNPVNAVAYRDEYKTRPRAISSVKQACRYL